MLPTHAASLLPHLLVLRARMPACMFLSGGWARWAVQSKHGRTYGRWKTGMESTQPTTDCRLLVSRSPSLDEGQPAPCDLAGRNRHAPRSELTPSYRALHVHAPRDMGWGWGAASTVTLPPPEAAPPAMITHTEACESRSGAGAPW